MRLVTYRTTEGTRAGRLEGDEIVTLGATDVGALLATGTGWATLAAGDGPRLPAASVALAPLVPRPPKVWCVGLNYANHIAEMGRQPPAHPTLFAKFPIALIGASDDIVLPAVSAAVDWEVELAVVIGRPGRHVAPARALDHVAGYTVLNDVSVRDWQQRTLQFLQGKTFERTTPVGPALVTPDELPRGARGLRVRCEVDGEVVQDDTTDQLLFDVAHVVAYVSAIATLEPGDLIATGTPSGVGAGRHPPVYLRSGQVVRTVIEGVGELVNRCVAELAPPGTSSYAGGMSDDQSSDEPSPAPPATAAPDDERVHTRAQLLDDERAAGSDDPRRQAEVILADSDLRSADRNAAPSSIVEHRRSDDTVDPT